MFQFSKQGIDPLVLLSYHSDVSALRKEFVIGTAFSIVPVTQIYIIIRIFAGTVVNIYKDCTKTPTDRPYPFTARVLDIGKDLLPVVLLPLIVAGQTCSTIYGIFKPLNAAKLLHSFWVLTDPKDTNTSCSLVSMKITEFPIQVPFDHPLLVTVYEDDGTVITPQTRTVIDTQDEIVEI